MPAKLFSIVVDLNLSLLSIVELFPFVLVVSVWFFLALLSTLLKFLLSLKKAYFSCLPLLFSFDDFDPPLDEMLLCLMNYRLTKISDFRS